MGKRVISLIIVALLLCSVCTAVSCADNKNPVKTGTLNTGKTGAVTETDDKFYGFDPLPKLSGAEGFNLIGYTRGPESGYTAWNTVDFYAEETTEEAINDSVYDRNEQLKTKYGFTVSQVISPKEQFDQAVASINSEDDAFNVIVADGQVSAALGQGGYLVDLKTVPYLTLEGPWWDQHANEQLSIANKLYFTTGDLSISANDATWICTYNKVVQEEQNVEDLYQLVRDNKWTIDKVQEINKSISTDLNDDGKRDVNDKYGYIYEPFNNYALFYSLGQSITKKNKDDIPELSVYSAASAEVFEIIRGISDDKIDYFIDWSTPCTAIIKDNRALMTSTTMYTVRANYRAWEQDFGILPMPKLTEDQPYVDVVSTATCGSLYSIPKSNKELDLTGYALEAFCRESKDTLRVAYYDLTITHKTMRDPESAEMMDIILANRYFDMAIIYNWGGWYQYFYNLWGTSGSNFASTYESAKDKTIAEINTTVDEFLKSN